MENLPAPTPSELKILHCLWQHGPSTVREVHDRVSGDVATSYTTTLKQMQIMHGKGLLRRDAQQRAHVFSAVPEQEETQQHMLDDFMSRVYEGSASRMILQALGISKPASSEELEEIDRLLQQLREDSRTDEGASPTRGRKRS